MNCKIGMKRKKFSEFKSVLSSNRIYMRMFVVSKETFRARKESSLLFDE